ncbi:phosphate ABC transporter substrate-binding protein PstS [Allocoleopsis franciscana]|uniref:Phosphate-binding protein n=1 Tax=Allocoleopsis franciscana PCC 7113 TaxID=1173027 RepID=K9W9K8_9CYAN|nr:phosphate ABC transporter substrate-binding protein PstS [Allocoleopsis franciscana]AFZ16933.1 phosphate ABC transporter substrate-binding protein, PhoT family [Allocoleopsis franciscana PCC 7113]
MLFRINLTHTTRLAASMALVAMTVGVTACSGPQGQDKAADGGTSSDTPTNAGSDKLALQQDVQLVGAGASFPAPLYQRWFQDLNGKYPKLQVNYQSVGSGAGVEQFTAGTVDFGASDTAMKDEEIQKVPADKGGVLLLPVSAGGIVLAYNVPGVDELKLPRQVYADILLGKIKKWNDPAIAKANPDAKLPDQNITVVHRSDGSGTTGVFTKHLSAISPEWKTKVGEGKTVQWPTGLGAKGNEGVTAQIQQTPGAIGYIEYGYAKQNNLKAAALENKAGKFVSYNDQSASKTLEAVQLPENLRAFIPDPEGDESYPVISYTWLLVHEKYPDATKAKAIEGMIEYALTEGQKVAPELGYVPLPKNVAQKVAVAADKISPDYNITVGQ